MKTPHRGIGVTGRQITGTMTIRAPQLKPKSKGLTTNAPARPNPDRPDKPR